MLHLEQGRLKKQQNIVQMITCTKNHWHYSNVHDHREQDEQLQK